MVTMSALHSLTAELHAGFLTLAFLCIIGVAISQVIVAMQHRMPKFLTRYAIKFRGYAEPTGYVGAIAGVIGLLLSAWTGMNAWPVDVLLQSGIIRNKIMLTIFATVAWIMVIFIRTKFGRKLWTCPMMATLYTGLVFVSFGLTVLPGCMGAHVTQGQSLLDPFWTLIGVDITKDFILLPTIFSGALVAVSAVALLIALMVAKKHGLFKIKLAPETCQMLSDRKFLKWDEPRLE